MVSGKERKNNNFENLFEVFRKEMMSVMPKHYTLLGNLIMITWNCVHWAIFAYAFPNFAIHSAAI